MAAAIVSAFRLKTTVTALAFFAAALALLFATAAPSPAQTYPSRPIRIIVTVAAGGAVDVLARLASEWIGRQTGQPVVVENRTGAGGTIAVETVAHSEPDGYTLLFATNGTVTVNRLLTKNAPVDTLDLIPVAPVARFSNLLVINAALPARTLKDFIALARAQPGKINYASAGLGSTPHLGGALFARLAGLDLVHVPYRGVAPAMTDLVSGTVQMIVIGYATVEPFVRSGALRVLTVGNSQRMSYLPDVPTAAEAGLPGWDIETWYSLFAPKATPTAIVDQLKPVNLAVAAALGDTDRRRLRPLFGGQGSNRDMERS